jgi:hypothetical protein
MRNLVHRGAPRPTYKYLSLKLARVVQCESALEVEVGHLLDASPDVLGYAEQPLRVHYEQDGTARSHVPDFVVMADGAPEFVEVKFAKDVSDEVTKRTHNLSILLREFGWSYRLVTEVETRAASWLSNARALLVRGRTNANPAWSLGAYDRLRRAGALPLSEFGWGELRAQESAWIANELIRGHVRVDLRDPLTSDSQLCVPEKAPRTWRTLPW